MRYKYHIFVCENLRDASDARGSCGAKGSHEIRLALKAAIKKHGLRHEVRPNASGCLDACQFGPSIVVYPEGVWYGGVTLGDVEEIVQSHLMGGKPVERLLIKDDRYTTPLTITLP